MALPLPQTEFAQMKLKELIASHYTVLNQLQAQMMAQQQGGEGGGVPGGANRGPTGGTGGGTPVRPQEQPGGTNPADALKGLLSQAGGA